jgi:uncharacterized membrane protein
MSEFIALIFDDPYKADESRLALLRLETEGLIRLSATAVIVRKADGRTRLSQDTSVVEPRMKAGRFAGFLKAAFAGALPMGFAQGVEGRVFGTRTEYGVSRKFLKQVAAKLEPGKSALVVRVRSDPAHPVTIDDRLRVLAPKGLGSNLSLET